MENNLQFYWLDLMQEMINDSRSARNIYQPSEYWYEHANSMVKIIKKIGMSNFRSSQSKSLLAFASGHSYKPTITNNSRFWKIHKTLLNIPLLSCLARKYDGQINLGYDLAKNQAHYKLKCIYSLLEKISPD